MPASCGLIATTAPAGTLCMIGLPAGGVTVTLTARACGFDTTIANGDFCASRMQTFIGLHVVAPGHELAGGSQRPCTAWLFAEPHASIVTFFTPGTPMQLNEPCTPITSTALSRSTAMYSQPM